MSVYRIIKARIDHIETEATKELEEKLGYDDNVKINFYGIDFDIYAAGTDLDDVGKDIAELSKKGASLDGLIIEYKDDTMADYDYISVKTYLDSVFEFPVTKLLDICNSDESDRDEDYESEDHYYDFFEDWGEDYGFPL